MSAPHSIRDTGRLAPGVHTVDSDGILQRSRGILPSYFADYWGDEQRWAVFRKGLRAGHISGLDADLTPDLVDDRADLPNLTVPALVIVGRHDVICGPRWGLELHELIPNSRLAVLEHSGHLEEPRRFDRAVREFVFSPKE
ncbi:alpha/beta fold hydrolase [Nocardia sp. NPDC059246]|uniref:alpha/beta fold hydrolase n=1 Tax=unclassified Nocardia TaxID=2637762 RepID=UPI003679318E